MTPNQIICGDALEVLKTMPSDFVQCVVTSPPYWGLRDYGTGSWDGGDQECQHSSIRRPGENDKSESNRDSSRDRVRSDCRICGATRSDQQMGLEPSLDDYIANMTAVFREVRRVLRPDGTLWLNMGDSYASSWACKRRNVVGQGAADADDRGRISDGLKEKDLCGVPWRLAFALQQPYYTGRIKREQDRIWLAAMIDAEGCMFIHKRKAGQSNGQGYFRQSDSFGPGLEVSNSSRAIVDRCLEIVGLGSICSQGPEQNFRRKQTLYRWNLRTTECRDVIREVYPYLVGKKHQARILCACPSSGKDAEKAHAGLISLHNGGTCDVDFAPPSSMFEPGFYLRSDIIWSKCNPMPESVTDRPTKAHEYVFLLSKRANYFYDAMAIREVTGRESSWDEYESGDGHDAPSGSLEDGVNSGFGSKRDVLTHPCGRNSRSVWTIATQPFAEAHFATMPEKLVNRCIQAGTPPKCCGVCAAPWERIVERESPPDDVFTNTASPDDGFVRIPTARGRKRVGSGQKLQNWFDEHPTKTLGWRPTCDHDDDSGRSIVLDPFMGAGTVALVAKELGRQYIGIELKPEYIAMAEKRLRQEVLGIT